MSTILEAAARRPCPTCGGSKDVVGPGQDLMESFFHHGLCPDCQDSSGQPTGLWLPELTVKCDVPCERLEAYCQCGGTGRVLALTTDNIDAAMERLGAYSGQWFRQSNYVGDGEEYGYEYCDRDARRIELAAHPGGIQAARIAAAEAVVKAVWPEVENE
jgi:hypothetical protein